MDRVVLVILDGVGIAAADEGNAVAQADTPTLDRLFAEYPYTELDAAGAAVGLPDGYIGNSEVGHLHIGAGRTVPQDLKRINEAIADRSLFERDALQQAVDHVREHDSRIHLLGIASDGGVHGHIRHMEALIDFFGEYGVDVVTHAILDGRDVSPESAEQYLEQLHQTAASAGTGEIGSFMGRFYAMDRDANWERTETAYRALIDGEGRTADSVSDGLETAREQDRNDYFVRPTIISDQYAPVGGHDVLLFTNYRKDRARQLSAAFVADDFDAFPRSHPSSVRFVSMVPYRETFDNPVLFDELTVEPALGDVLADNDVSQLRLSESQKQPHVTYFFDGKRETRFDGADVKIFPSADVAAYDEKPAMEADAITAYAVDVMRDDRYGFILLNYPNGDLVGHTGDIDAAVTAMETVDSCIDRLVSMATEQGYTVVITADHGNCEKMRDDGEMYTAHTLNKVPFCIVSDTDHRLEQHGGLANVAPTICDLLNLPQPDAFTDSLISHER